MLNSSKSLFRPGGANYMPVGDLDSATTWYKEKFGVKRVDVELDDGEGCISLGSSPDECLFVLGPRGKSSGELNAMLFTSDVKKAREYLLSENVYAGEIQKDAQGTTFFEARDLDGNLIEVSEEP